MGSTWVQDAFGQNDLTLKSLKLATEFLKPNGTFVTKVFRSADYNSLIWVFRQFFKKVVSTKPSASRNESAEIYVICEKYLAPNKIDPKLLDAKYIFQQIDVKNQTSLDIFTLKKKPRQREGYEEGTSVLYKEIPVSEFIETEDTVKILSNYNAITWDSKEIENHPSTVEEIKELFKDLKLLGKRDVRDILKWKRDIQKFLSKNDPKPIIEKEEKVLTEEERELLLDQELENQIRQQIQKKRRKLKKVREKNRKMQRKIDLNMIIPGDTIEQGEDQELFSASKIDKQVFDDPNLPQIKLHNKNAQKIEKYISVEKDEYNELIENHFNKLFESSNPKQRKKLERIKENIKDNINLDDFSFEDSSEGFFFFISFFFFSFFFVEILGEDGSKIDNELLVDLKEEVPISTKSNIWFQQDIFDDMEDGLDDKIAIEKMKEKYMLKTEKENLEENKKRKRDDDFEVVKLEQQPLDDEDEMGSSYDSQDRAETLALGAMVAKGKTSINSLVDSSFNKRTFDDPQDLPKWFIQEEKKHNQVMLPITKQEVDDMRQRMRELNARSIGKVAEAKARKKRKLIAQKEKMAKKAVSIVQAENMSEQEKMRNIKKLYSQTQEKKKDKVYVVSRSFKTRGNKAVSRGGKFVKFVDRRMLADKRGQDISKKRGLKKKKNKNKKKKK